MGRNERVRSARDHDRLRREGRRAGDAVLRIQVVRNGLDWPRLGCVVSRKAGKAVTRNRLRRLYSAAFRAIKHDLPAGVDVLVTPTRGAEDPTLADVQRSLRKLVQQVADKLPPWRAPEAKETGPAPRRGKAPRPEAPGQETE